MARDKMTKLKKQIKTIKLITITIILNGHSASLISRHNNTVLYTYIHKHTYKHVFISGSKAHKTKINR